MKLSDIQTPVQISLEDMPADDYGPKPICLEDMPVLAPVRRSETQKAVRLSRGTSIQLDRIEARLERSRKPRKKYKGRGARHHKRKALTKWRNCKLGLQWGICQIDNGLWKKHIKPLLMESSVGGVVAKMYKGTGTRSRPTTMFTFDVYSLKGEKLYDGNALELLSLSGSTEL